MTDIQSGSYAHRFTGNAMDMAGTPYFLAGVGVMQIVNGIAGITLTGRQESVTMPIQGFGGQVVNVAYDLSGTVTKHCARGTPPDIHDPVTDGLAVQQHGSTGATHGWRVVGEYDWDASLLD